MRVIIISGLAGSGKSVALDMLEDLGYYCIDNLPISLLRDITADTLHDQHAHFEKLAVGVDARAHASEIESFPARIASLRAAGIDIQVIYLEADPEVILRRYSETRRKHPLSNAQRPLTEAITADRELLAPIAEQANLVLDTSHSNIHQLRELIRTRVEANGEDGMSILLQSFGFKHGVPDAVDFVFDVRCLPNPHWINALRNKTGLDDAVAHHLEQSPETAKMLQHIENFFHEWLPCFERENRAYVTIAIGCTGGKHRSVYLVERLAERLKENYPLTLVRHTELP